MSLYRRIRATIDVNSQWSKLSCIMYNCISR